jgi:hypothetical protein
MLISPYLTLHALEKGDISIENFISLRHAVKVDSLFEGQGFLKCGCCGKNKCETNTCVRKGLNSLTL